MKNLIAYFLMVVTLITGSVTFASANSASMAIGSALGSAAAGFFRVPENTIRYHYYTASAGEELAIELAGDGDTDLDLYVYDSRGRLIDSASGSSDYEISNIDVFKNTTLKIKVVNRGSIHNNYSLTVWK